MLKRIAMVGVALSVLVATSGAGCCLPVNCCWTNAVINGASLLRDLFNYQIAI